MEGFLHVKVRIQIQGQVRTTQLDTDRVIFDPSKKIVFRSKVEVYLKLSFHISDKFQIFYTRRVSFVIIITLTWQICDLRSQRKWYTQDPVEYGNPQLTKNLIGYTFGNLVGDSVLSTTFLHTKKEKYGEERLGVKRVSRGTSGGYQQSRKKEGCL